MGTRALPVIGSLLLVGFAVAVAIARTETEPEGTIAFHGSEASLNLLSVEAQRCGLPNAKIQRIGKFLALTVQTSGPADSRATCVVEWVLAHPEAKIGFLGNQAFTGEDRSS
jgi:hypothetical protein